MRKKILRFYIGDDTTDEDAFAAVSTHGFGILVAEQDRKSQAQYRVANVEEVKHVLTFLNQL